MTGGLGDGWLDVVRAVARRRGRRDRDRHPVLRSRDGRPDDPGGVRAARFARGATPIGVLHELADLDVAVPLVVMTYYNLVFHAGHERFAASLADGGVGGAILPDLPLDESAPWCAAADARTSRRSCSPRRPPPTTGSAHLRPRARLRLRRRAGGSHRRARDARRETTVMAKRLKAVTDSPCSPASASRRRAGRGGVQEADGVIDGLARSCRLLLDGGGPDEAGAFVAERARRDRRGVTRTGGRR